MFRSALRATLIALPLLSAAPVFAHNGVDHSKDAETTAPAEAHAEITIGDLVITGAFTRATLPKAPVGGGYFTVHNAGAADDRLVAVSSPVAKEGQIHEMAMVGDVMKMQQLSDGLIIPAGESVELKPGGYHLMLMGLSEQLVEGQTIPLTLTFETAGEITIDLPIAATAASGAPCHMSHE
jgi:copper(I)-binding protein